MPKTHTSHSYTYPDARTRPHPSVRRKTLRTRYGYKRRTILYLVVAGMITGILVAWFFTSLLSHHQTSMDTSGYSVVGKPTIDADLINRVLERYHSPASGKGQALYDGGVKYG